MLTKNIRLKKFGIKKNKKKIKYRFLKSLNFYKNHKLIKSFSNDYSYDFSQHQIKKFKKFNNYNLVGMGGSSLGTKAIYNFLKPKVKKRFTFIDNLNSRREHQSKEKRLNMSRSVWKGPFVEESLIKKVEKIKNDPNKKPIKTWSRKSTIIPDFVGFSFLIYNGKKFIPITISEDMVGHKFGEFAPTRQFFGHTPADKKAKVESESKGENKK